MFLNDWKKPVVLRFGTLDLVRADWRKYTKDLSDDNKIPSQTTQFDVSAVNIEENGKRLSVRTQCEGVCGKVFQSVGVAPPPTIREV